VSGKDPQLNAAKAGPGAPSREAALFDSAMAFHQGGNLKQAERAYRDVLTINPRHVGALNYLGVLAHQTGHSDDGIALLKKALEVTRRDPEIHFNLALIHSSLGRDEDAIRHNIKALKIKPDYADAHTNMGVLVLRKGQWDEAIKHFNRALLFKPSSTARENLAKAQFAAGKDREALSTVIEALSKEDSEPLQRLFALVIRSVPESDLPGLPGLEHLLIRAMQEAWCRPRYLSGIAASLLLRTSPIAEAASRIDLAWPDVCSAAQVFEEGCLAALQSNKLLNVLLTQMPNVSIPLERLLTALRRALLVSLAPRGEPAGNGNLGLRSALALQCFINEYVFAVDDKEAALAGWLRDSVAEALNSEKLISPGVIAAVASYFPLHSIPGGEQLTRLTWPEPVQRIIKQQVIEVRNDQEIRHNIAQLTPIVDETSQLVREQYEQNPYPRWVNTVVGKKPVSVDQYIRTRFPRVPYRNIDDGNVDLLIAGCGTGIHAIERAAQFRLRTILAIDLSLSSLSYAVRKAREFGLASLEFAQADILNAQDIGRQFHVIDSAGVLHHLRDPLDGWRKLIGLLKPNGLMHIGLYSLTARNNVRNARQLIEDRNLGRSETAIRSFRQQLLDLDPGDLLAPIAKFPDFFTLSECRDLLFHIQEHQFDIPQIASFLNANKLNFLGFETTATEAYLKRFPDDKAAVDLENWQTFEYENPVTFAGMYQFWVQRKA
jgi:Flp pilus assembly protein TadD/2-polyprenyl-3-methyl-5-hydroxy-6-metoxy-1,4-benzoquinol methylase